MQKRTLVVVAVVAALAFAAGLSLAAAPKQYQFTGTVVEVDAKANMISVDKGGDVWDFSTTGLKDPKLKKGDKVTVHYQMLAKKIEGK
jgi:membrane protein implicated in regulation of membrane protease activity